MLLPAVVGEHLACEEPQLVVGVTGLLALGAEVEAGEEGLRAEVCSQVLPVLVEEDLLELPVPPVEPHQHALLAIVLLVQSLEDLQAEAQLFAEFAAATLEVLIHRLCLAQHSYLWLLALLLLLHLPPAERLLVASSHLLQFLEAPFRKLLLFAGF